MLEAKTMQANALLPLDSAAATLAVVGGKGANLAKLAHAGFPVPGGFLVTTQAYDEFVAANQLEAWIQTTVAQANPTEPASLEAASIKIRGCFAAGVLPPDLATDLRLAYQKLGQPPVAVRSSDRKSVV